MFQVHATKPNTSKSYSPSNVDALIHLDTDGQKLSACTVSGSVEVRVWFDEQEGDMFCKESPRFYLPICYNSYINELDGLLLAQEDDQLQNFSRLGVVNLFADNFRHRSDGQTSFSMMKVWSQWLREEQ